MTQREKLLAAAVLGLLLLFGGRSLWTNYQDSLTAKRSQRAAAQARLGEAKLARARGRQAYTNLQDWQQRSLPADRQVAQSLYRTWLQDRFTAAGLAIEDIQPNVRTAPNDAYQVVGYTITARGTLKAVTNLLYDYYRSTLLQQITELRLQPGTGASQLLVTFQTEALLVVGTTRDTLPEGEADRLAKSSAEEYVTSIDGRNLFTAYRPPRPDPPPRVVRDAPPSPEFDHAKFAFFTGTVGNGNGFQAWINVRTTNESLRLSAGDPIKVGLFEGRVVSVEPRALVVETGDKKLRVELGTSLRDGKELKSEGDAAATADTDATET